MPNKYCDSENLYNEADVEQIFVRRLLEDLGYEDRNIRPKDSLSRLTVGGLRGQPQRLYRPDFALKCGKQIKWIVEAKSPDEALDIHEWQPRAYCSRLNGEYRGENPTAFFLLTNGHLSRVYRWDVNQPELELTFDDFETGNARFEQLVQLLSIEQIEAEDDEPRVDSITLHKLPLSEVTNAFAWCHQHIYKKDNISQAEAFSEFVKLVSLKLLSDRDIKDAHPEVLAEESVSIPLRDVTFCKHWIEEQERHTANPMADIRFRQFLTDMEHEIARGTRKRIFDANATINLKPETIKGVAGRLEHVFLFGIDVDLNGRLFETFLNATMRGKDLGQYFTPRSIVRLGVLLAQLKVDVPMPGGRRHTDTVLDACCGSGGFLIDALASMYGQIDNRQDLSDERKERLRHTIATTNICGIDVGRAPNLARVARLNMYLHGDGGSRIFQVDALDKEIEDVADDSVDTANEKEQLRNLLADGGVFDIVLTNPPFAKVYERSVDSEDRIIDQYDIGRSADGAPRQSLITRHMFIERYRDLLKPGGRLITVIDDGTLSGTDYSWFRDFIRSSFIIKAVISLPGDAFQRSKARVKTSLLIAEKRDPAAPDDQPAVFMYPARYIGIDDSARQRALPIDKINREKANDEIAEILEEFQRFESGAPNQKYVVPPDRVRNRLDVKNCLMQSGRLVNQWLENGVTVQNLDQVVRPREFADDEIIVTRDYDEQVTPLVVRYEGYAEADEPIVASDSKYARLFKVRAGDIVISNIAASHGSIAVVPPELDGCVVSTEYTVLEALPPYQPGVAQLIIRSPEIRSDILLKSTGINRTRMKWEFARDIQVPAPGEELSDEVCAMLEGSREAAIRAEELSRLAKERIEAEFGLANEEALTVLAAFKPPK